MKNVTFIEKQFQATNKSRISELCEDKNHAIIQLIVKLTLLTSTQDHEHWKNTLAGVITSQSRSKLKKGQRFDYNWFFDRYGQVDIDLIESVFDTLPSRYDSIKPTTPDFELASDNCDNFRLIISQEYARLGRVLNKAEVINCINQLNLYKE